MSDPILYQAKLLKPAVLLLEKGVGQQDETLRVLSLRALGNMALGAPKKVPLPTLSPKAGRSVHAGVVLSPREGTGQGRGGLRAPCAPRCGATGSCYWRSACVP